jgi:hypothetical protein
MFKMVIVLAIPALLFFSVSKKKTIKAEPAVQKTNTVKKGFALLELFTSEGCSSCPPADALLPEWEKLAADVIPLSFHVDYWNRLGWKDPYSDAAYTQRQQDYAKQWELESVYTPQLVVNGTKELVGSNKNKVTGIIETALQEEPSVTIAIDSVKEKNTTVSFSATLNGDIDDAVLNIALVQKETTSMVTAGENDGRKLKHHNVVRSFKVMPARQQVSGTIEWPETPHGATALILYTQRKSDLKITGATITPPLLVTGQK